MGRPILIEVLERETIRRTYALGHRMEEFERDSPTSSVSSCMDCSSFAAIETDPRLNEGVPMFGKATFLGCTA